MAYKYDVDALKADLEMLLGNPWYRATELEVRQLIEANLRQGGSVAQAAIFNAWKSEKQYHANTAPPLAQQESRSYYQEQKPKLQKIFLETRSNPNNHYRIPLPLGDIPRRKPEKVVYKMDAYFTTLEQAMRLRNYARATMRQYEFLLRHFAAYCDALDEKFSPAVNEKLVVDYMLKRRDDGWSTTTLCTFRAALRLYCEVNGSPRDFAFIRNMKKEKRLPVVLTASEVARLLATIKNPKHWLMVSLMYASGLRVSEVVRLRVQNVDCEKHTLTVRQAKGRKDRVTVISEKQVALLGEFMAGKNKGDLLFTSSHAPHRALAVRSLQKVVERALLHAGIRKGASAHSLRHCFATHLLENGTDIRFIQKMLGHSSLSTTAIYTKVATHQIGKIKSPL
ncbi:MAG TPA: tyrosine-type recombinase/integrase [Turneriella sp.]|nr:tyrosine-type recombinase/integrase [Turneriella sp.]